MIRTTILALVFASLVIPSTQLQAGLIINGGFEDAGGSFNGWTVLNEVGGSGNWYIQSGTTAPPGLSTPVQPPPGPIYAAMTNQNGPGSHVLYQDFSVPAGVTSATLSFQRYVDNQANAFITPNTLSRLGDPNQQARVDFILPSADPFSVLPSDVALNVYQTQVGDPLNSGYTPDVTDVTSLLQNFAGQTLRLRFAEVDNQLFFRFGIDEVGLEAEIVPEPSSLGIWGLGCLVLTLPRFRRRT